MRWNEIFPQASVVTLSVVREHIRSYMEQTPALASRNSLLFQAAEACVCLLPELIMKLVYVQTLFLLAKLTSYKHTYIERIYIYARICTKCAHIHM